MRRAARVDGNAPALVTFARQLGALVEVVPGCSASPGRPDVFVAFSGGVLLAELKRAPTGKRGGGAGKLSKEQERWHAAAARRGVTVHVWRTRDDVLRSLGLQRCLSAK